MKSTQLSEMNPNHDLLSPLEGVIIYHGIGSRTAPQVLSEKIELLRRNAINILQVAHSNSVNIGGVKKSVGEILSGVYRSGNSGWTLYPEESKVLLAFVQSQLRSLTSYTSPDAKAA